MVLANDAIRLREQQTNIIGDIFNDVHQVSMTTLARKIPHELISKDEAGFTLSKAGRTGRETIVPGQVGVTSPCEWAPPASCQHGPLQRRSQSHLCGQSAQSHHST